MLPLLITAALAAEPTDVLVSSLQARNPEAAGLAALVESFLAQELKKNADIHVIRIEDTPEFQDYPARTYMEGCPPGEIEGCTYVVGERGGAELAVTGTVQSLVTGTKVQIVILDIGEARQLISFTSELESGGDEAFAEGVAKVLVAAIAGEVGQERDIRLQDGEEEEPMDNAAVARQLQALSREMGGVTAVISRSNKEVVRPKYSLADVAEKMESEGTKPWERLDMGPQEYVQYKNSGLSLYEWRLRAVGRHGQVLLRPAVGIGSGPWSGTYYGRTAYDVVGTQLQVVDAYSAQAVQQGTGGFVGIAAAYGLTPVLDVGAIFGVSFGSFTLDVNQKTVGQAEPQAQVDTAGQTTLVFGPQVSAAFFPVWKIRPAVGGGVLIERGRTVIDAESVPEGLSIFSPATLVSGEIWVGGEARLSKRVDLYLQVPVQLRFAGDVLIENREGTADEVAADPPETAGVAAAGVRAGLQIRLLGKKVEETTRYDEVDEPAE